MVKKAKETNLAELTRRILLQSYAPASVLVDEKGNILFVHGETGKYLRPPPGTATLNVVEMAREDLQLELRAALYSAAQQGTPTLAREITVKADGVTQAIGLSVRPLVAADANHGLLLVSFQELVEQTTSKRARTKRPAHAADGQSIDDIVRELAYTRENLQATIEEQQASNEELKSTNEELQSTNEELQSTNEELETSREELQSVNEELVTVNAELQAKIEQLASMQNDMKNLLDNVSGGIVFLDQNLVIRRYTREAARVYRLVSSDVGRPLADIKSDLARDDLLIDASAVLDTLVPCEREVQTIEGAWYLVRVQPYRTLDNVIDGVVLSFSNISQRIAADSKARTARRLAESIVDTIGDPLLVLDDELKVVSANRSFYTAFGVVAEHTVGRALYALGSGQWDIPALRTKLSAILPDGDAFDGFSVEGDFPKIGQCKWWLNARRIVSDSHDTPLILLAMKQASHE